MIISARLKPIHLPNQTISNLVLCRCFYETHRNKHFPDNNHTNNSLSGHDLDTVNLSRMMLMKMFLDTHAHNFNWHWHWRNDNLIQITKMKLCSKYSIRTCWQRGVFKNSIFFFLVGKCRNKIWKFCHRIFLFWKWMWNNSAIQICDD